MYNQTQQVKRTPGERDALYRKISEVDTSPLTRMNISKKHVRILLALFMVKDNSVSSNIYLGLNDLQELIARITYKRYPYLDIVSFALDLSARGYVEVQLDDDERYCKITAGGVTLLEKLAQMPNMYLEGSTTPNYHPVVH